MAEAPAYTTVTGKLQGLLAKIRETGVPAKVNQVWLESLGFKSKNDRSMVTVLRYIGFIDASSVPTPAWKEYRGANSKAVLGRAIKLGYSDLYSTYPDAHARQNSDIAHVFSIRTDAGKQVIDKMVSTFKALVANADFDAATDIVSVGSVDPTSAPEAVTTTITARPASTATGLHVNINVQLTLPETTDGKVYEAFFQAMREHLLSEDT